jgi:hypothetical protein
VKRKGLVDLLSPRSYAARAGVPTLHAPEE